MITEESVQKLREFLADKNIHINSGILNDFICKWYQITQQTNSEIPNKDSSPLFKLKKPSSGDKYVIAIRKYDRSQKIKAQYIRQCMLGGYWAVHSEIDNDLIERLKTEVLEIATNNPEALHHYQNVSKPMFEEESLEKIGHLAFNLIGKIDSLKEKDGSLENLNRELLVIMGTLNIVCSIPGQYTHLLDALEQLKSLKADPDKADPDIVRVQKLAANMELLCNEIEPYKKYTCAPAKIAAKVLYEELEQFLNSHKLSFTKSNIVEDTLLRLAGITNPPDICRFINGHRYIITFEEMNENDAQKLLSYFKTSGDPTATYMITRAMSEGSERKEITKYAFEVDAKILYEKIFPDIKKHIVDGLTTTPDMYKKYCRNVAATAGNTYGMFGNQSPRQNAAPEQTIAQQRN